jgi:hypothetical protein
VFENRMMRRIFGPQREEIREVENATEQGTL